GQHNKVERWRDYLPDWEHFIQSISSITTIHSPHVAYRRAVGITEQTPRVLVTQYQQISQERCIADNFGTAYDLRMYPNPVPGLFDSLCLAPENLDKHMSVGTKTSSSLIEIFSNIAHGQALTFAQLAMAHSEGIPKVEPYTWAHSFHIFVGATCRDRIN